MLEKAGMLERFYTDITGDLNLGKVLSTGAMLPFPDSPASTISGTPFAAEHSREDNNFPRSDSCSRLASFSE